MDVEKANPEGWKEVTKIPGPKGSKAPVGSGTGPLPDVYTWAEKPVDKATRTERVSAKGTKRGMNPSTNLGLVNSFGGSAFKPPRPVRKDMDGLTKAVNELREFVKSAQESLDKGAAENYQKVLRGMEEQDKTHKFDTSLGKVRPRREDEPLEMEKASAAMNVMGHPHKQPGTKPIPGGEKAFMQTKVRKAEPVTSEDMEGLSKSLLGLTDIVKSMNDVMKAEYPAPRAKERPPGRNDSMGRNYKKPEKAESR